jgi:hypothetical protein
VNLSTMDLKASCKAGEVISSLCILLMATLVG